MPLVALKLGMTVLGFNSMRLNDIDPSAHLYDSLLYGLAALVLAQFVYFGLGVFRSASNAKSRVWGFLARAAIVIGVIGGVANVIRMMLPNNVSDLRESAAILNAQLPRKMTDSIVLNRVGYDDRVITFHYAWTLPPGQRVHRESLGKNFQENMCGEFKAEFRGRALSRVDAVYTINGREKMTVSATGQDCS